MKVHDINYAKQKERKKGTEREREGREVGGNQEETKKRKRLVLAS